MSTEYSDKQEAAKQEAIGATADTLTGAVATAAASAIADLVRGLDTSVYDDMVDRSDSTVHDAITAVWEQAYKAGVEATEWRTVQAWQKGYSQAKNDFGIEVESPDRYDAEQAAIEAEEVDRAAVSEITSDHNEQSWQSGYEKGKRDGEREATGRITQSHDEAYQSGYEKGKADGTAQGYREGQDADAVEQAWQVGYDHAICAAERDHEAEVQAITRQAVEVAQRAYERGRRQGHKDAENICPGCPAHYADGIRQGKAEAEAAAYDAHRASHRQGYDVGYQRGFPQGRQQGHSDAIALLSCHAEQCRDNAAEFPVGTYEHRTGMRGADDAEFLRDKLIDFLPDYAQDRPRWNVTDTDGTLLGTVTATHSGEAIRKVAEDHGGRLDRSPEDYADFLSRNFVATLAPEGK